MAAGLCELILHRGFDIVQTFFPVLQPNLENTMGRIHVYIHVGLVLNPNTVNLDRL